MADRYQIKNNFVVLTPEKQAFVESADAGLYQRIDQNYNGFAGCELLSCHEFESDWESWEMHPNGDEIVLLLSGAVTFVLQSESGDVEISLAEQGQYLIVPGGIWHTAKTKTQSKVLFITPGQNTQHRSSNT